MVNGSEICRKTITKHVGRKIASASSVTVSCFICHDLMLHLSHLAQRSGQFHASSVTRHASSVTVGGGLVDLERCAVKVIHKEGWQTGF